MLRMSRHGPSSNEDDEARNEVSLGASVLLPAEPDPSETGAPPDNTHRGMLDIITTPGLAP